MTSKTAHRLSVIQSMQILTDRIKYDKSDQVFPMHPEQCFYIDEIDRQKIKGASALEIGLGSGVLSIAAAKAGARKVTALEINPRAKNFAGYNIMQNGVEEKIEIRDGNEDIFKPVKKEKFDYIISNPPFEPTPQGIEYFMHSSGGIYGLDFVEKLLKGVDEHLTEKGHAQIVTFAPGDHDSPSMLIGLINKYLPGRTQLKVNPISMRYDDLVDRFTQIGKATIKQVDEMKERAQADGVTHLYLCMIHYDKGKKSLTMELSEKIYENWDLPLESKI